MKSGEKAVYLLSHPMLLFVRMCYQLLAILFIKIPQRIWKSPSPSFSILYIWKGNVRIHFKLPSKDFLHAAFGKKQDLPFNRNHHFLRCVAFLAPSQCVLYLTSASLPAVFSLNLPFFCCFVFLKNNFPLMDFLLGLILSSIVISFLEMQETFRQGFVPQTSILLMSKKKLAFNEVTWFISTMGGIPVS